MKRSARLSVWLLALYGWTAGAPAITLDCGPTLCFEYDATQPAILVLGSPTRVGDSMQFLPPAFFAQSAGSAGLHTASVSFVFDRVYAALGGSVVSLRVQQEGDYEIAGNGSVTALLDLTATGNAGADEVSASDEFVATGTVAPPGVFLLDAALTAASGLPGAAPDLRLTLGLLLQANAADMAWIQTKFLITAGETTVMPVPGSLWLLGTATLACVARARRRRSRLQPSRAR